MAAVAGNGYAALFHTARSAPEVSGGLESQCPLFHACTKRSAPKRRPLCSSLPRLRRRPCLPSSPAAPARSFKERPMPSAQAHLHHERRPRSSTPRVPGAERRTKLLPSPCRCLSRAGAVRFFILSEKSSLRRPSRAGADPLFSLPERAFSRPADSSCRARRQRSSPARVPETEHRAKSPVFFLSPLLSRRARRSCASLRKGLYSLFPGPSSMELFL